MIAAVAGISQPRVSKIASEPSGTRPDAMRRRLPFILERPGGALWAQADGFTGRMLYPPYERPMARWVPTVWRRDRQRVQPEGRVYGETTAAEQEQADRRYWAVGAEVRARAHPLLLAVDGKVERVYEAAGWIRESGQTKYPALGAGRVPWVLAGVRADMVAVRIRAGAAARRSCKARCLHVSANHPRRRPSPSDAIVSAVPAVAIVCDVSGC